MTDDRIADQIVRLGMIFAEHPAYASLEKKFFNLVSLRRAQLAAGIAPEVEGIVVTGPPGAGKSMAVQELLRSFRECEDRGDDGNICEALSCLVPSPATEKSVGITCLRSLGYKLERDRPAHIIWDMVRDNLRDRQTLFVHFDEAQHLCEKQTPREIQSVISTLKSLLQNPGWPVGLILSGTPLLKEMINQDAQLTRRLYPIELKALNALQDIDVIIGTLRFYVGKAGLDVCPDSLSAEFVARLVHAACGEFGLLIKFIILAIEQTLRQGKTEVGPAQFQTAYADKSGCMDGMNPFIAVDFERIDCSKLYGEGDTYGI